MDLAQLKKKGGVIADALVPKEVEWKHADKNGKPITDKFTVHVRRHAFGVMEAMFAGGEAERGREAWTLGQGMKKPVAGCYGRLTRWKGGGDVVYMALL